MKIISFIFFLIPYFFLFSQDIPYPQSTRFDSINWHWDTYYYSAIESDLWPVTWGLDDNIYTSWGDGSGFGGDDSLGWVSLGFGKIEGLPDSFNGFNIWGGINSPNSATFEGKCATILSVDGILYSWINMQNGVPPDFKLAWSTDLGAHWNLSNSQFSGSGSFFPYSFINFGKNYEGRRDEYIYCYGGQLPYVQGFTNNVYLMRTQKNNILNRNDYEFLSGFDQNNRPIWSLDIIDAYPVFTDTNGVSDGLSSIYNSGIGMYILTVGHRSNSGNPWGAIENLGIFVSPEPWGPWSTVAYYDNWGDFNDLGEALGYHIPTKWISEDGKTFWVIFSSESFLDRFNIVKATLVENSTFQISVSINDGWNLVSIPGLQPDNQNVTTWWSGKDPNCKCI